MQELDTVVLTEDIASHNLYRGDIGAIVHRYRDGLAFEVEFVTGDGGTIAVLTLTKEQIRLMNTQEILHARTLMMA